MRSQGRVLIEGFEPPLRGLELLLVPRQPVRPQTAQSYRAGWGIWALEGESLPPAWNPPKIGPSMTEGRHLPSHVRWCAGIEQLKWGGLPVASH
jgi:hypothetical protein